MATKYIDTGLNPRLEDISVSDTSTVTNKVRVAWDTTVTREQLHIALTKIRDKLVDPKTPLA